MNDDIYAHGLDSKPVTHEFEIVNPAALDEARASVALDHDECGSPHSRECALAYLARKAADTYPWTVYTYQQLTGVYSCYLKNGPSGQGKTPAEAIVECARAVGWTG